MMLPRMYSKEPGIMDEFRRIIVDAKYDEMIAENANYEEIVIGDKYISFTSRINFQLQMFLSSNPEPRERKEK